MEGQHPSLLSLPAQLDQWPVFPEGDSLESEQGGERCPRRRQKGREGQKGKAGIGSSASRKDPRAPSGRRDCHQWGGCSATVAGSPVSLLLPHSPLTRVPGAMPTEECPTLAHRPTPEGTWRPTASLTFFRTCSPCGCDGEESHSPGPQGCPDSLSESLAPTSGAPPQAC